MSLTKTDKNWIVGAVSQIVQDAEVRIKTELREDISHLPTREEFNEMKDEILGTLNKHEDELLILSSRMSRLEEEVLVLKKKVK